MLKITVFMDVMAHSLVDCYRCFVGMYCHISEVEGGLESKCHENIANSMGRLIYPMSADLKPSDSRKPSYPVILTI
jgi:hypothetical protein